MKTSMQNINLQPQPAPHYYLAYGSNLHKGQMAHRCPTAQPIGTIVVPGYQLMFRGGTKSAVATIEPVDSLKDTSAASSKPAGFNPEQTSVPTQDKSVPAAIWAIQPSDERSLDVYEGYPFFYRKETLEVELNGRMIQAMAYVMNDGHPVNLPSRQYLDTIAVARHIDHLIIQLDIRQGALDKFVDLNKLRVYRRAYVRKNIFVQMKLRLFQWHMRNGS